jgi:hypothetical protein
MAQFAIRNKKYKDKERVRRRAPPKPRGVAGIFAVKNHSPTPLSVEFASALVSRF